MRFLKFPVFICIIILTFLQSCEKRNTSEDYPVITTTVKEVNVYGNLDLNISFEDLSNNGYEAGDLVNVQISGLEPMTIPIANAYLSAGYWGITLCISFDTPVPTLAVGNGSFADKIGGKEGDTVIISMSKKEGYKQEEEDMNLVMSTSRSDYQSDEMFANFRMVKVGKMKGQFLYRSSTPYNSEENPYRYLYTDSLAKAAGIKNVLDLAESSDAIDKMIASNQDVGPYCYDLYLKDNLFAKKMGVDIYLEKNAKVFADHIRYIIDNDPPFLINCLRGKDRTGLFCLLTGLLADATLEEIESDYVSSFVNFYFIEKNSARYNEVKKKVFYRILYIIYKQNTDINLYELNTLDIDPTTFFSELKQSARNYFTQTAGLTPEELENLLQKITQ